MYNYPIPSLKAGSTHVRGLKAAAQRSTKRSTETALSNSFSVIPVSRQDMYVHVATSLI